MGRSPSQLPPIRAPLADDHLAETIAAISGSVIPGVGVLADVRRDPVQLLEGACQATPPAPPVSPDVPSMSKRTASIIA